jgi:hypothetical protein
LRKPTTLPTKLAKESELVWHQCWLISWSINIECSSIFTISSVYSFTALTLPGRAKTSVLLIVPAIDRDNIEENIKGTIESGKLDDFTILDQNPLKVASEQIKNITVKEVIIGGKQVYRF